MTITGQQRKKFNSSRIVLKCMVKYSNDGFVDNEKDFESTGSQILFNSNVIWNGTNRTQTEKWEQVTCDLTPYIDYPKVEWEPIDSDNTDRPGKNFLEFSIKMYKSEEIQYFHFGEITICVDDSPWWLLTANELHIW